MLATLVLTLALAADKPPGGFPKGSPRPDPGQCAAMCLQNGTLTESECRKNGGTPRSCKEVRKIADKNCRSVCTTGAADYDPSGVPPVNDPPPNDPYPKNGAPPPQAPPQ